MSAIGAWENTRKATVEVHLKQIEEEIEKEKAEQVERMTKKMANIYKMAPYLLQLSLLSAAPPLSSTSPYLRLPSQSSPL